MKDRGQRQEKRRRKNRGRQRKDGGGKEKNVFNLRKKEKVEYGGTCLEA